MHRSEWSFLWYVRLGLGTRKIPESCPLAMYLDFLQGGNIFVKCPCIQMDSVYLRYCMTYSTTV